MNEDLRLSIEAALTRQEWDSARSLMRRLMRLSPSVATARFLLSSLERHRGWAEVLAEHRLAILRSFTLEPVVPLLCATAASLGLRISVQFSDFNAYAQEILDSGSRLYQFNPSFAVLAVQTQDLTPDLWFQYTSLSPAEVRGCVVAAHDRLAELMGTFRRFHTAPLIVHNLQIPALPSAGVLDVQVEQSQVESIREINRRLVKTARAIPGTFVVDYDGLVSRYGMLSWRDERKWLSVRMPIAADCLIHLANEYLRFLLPLAGKTCKGLVVDLDNTLWGGVIGEDGLDGIQLGPEYPGAAFLALQRAILDLYQRGVILAICSKNNIDDAMEVLEKHPGMLLRPEHFGAHRINWHDKSRNLREIAAELNIGIESLAFLDDNPLERERVATELPEIYVIDLPNDPVDYAPALRQCPLFESLRLSSEDRERTRYYIQERQRQELFTAAGSLEDFYCSLHMEAEIQPVTSGSIARAAQLTQKTNQFNLTTRRYTEQQIAAMLQDGNKRAYYLRVADKFGDSGIVGVAITCQLGDTIEIESFLLSCRVIGRTLETALLAHLAQEAVIQGARRLQGWFRPTKKNAPAKEFYFQHGFRIVEKQVNGETLWEFNLRAGKITCPKWIRCTASTAEAYA